VATLAYMTINDYLMTMKPGEYTRVQVAQLKARLSEHLRAAQGGGTVIVVSRDTPVALLGPPPGRISPLVLRRPRPDAIPLSKVRLPPAADPPMDIDIVDLLLRERGDR
jgi:antitoxin (DNA-binding transcriptional repressor) of toxin-antitoxin stability system